MSDTITDGGTAHHQHGEITARDLLDKIGEVYKMVRRLAEDQAATAVRLTSLVEDLGQLRTHVIDGNGEPSLLHRVAQLETHRYHDRNTLQSFALRLGEIAGKLDDAANERRAQSEAFGAREESERKDRVGWIVAVVVGLLGLLGAVFQGLSPVIFGK